MASHWSATGLIISGVAIAIIMSTPSSRINEPACDAAVSEFDWTSLTMNSTAYDWSPSMMPSATKVSMPAMMNSLASPNPASGPVSGAVKPILIEPSPPPPPNWAALAPPAGAAVPAVVSPVVPGGAVAPVVSAGAWCPAVVSPGVSRVSAAPPSSSSPPHAARNAAAAAELPKTNRRRRLSNHSFNHFSLDSLIGSPSMVDGSIDGASRRRCLRCQSSRGADLF